jgi:hypothetical protein
MPYPSEHAARINDPKKYEKVRRENDKFGSGIDAIWGITADGKAELQAIRFDASKYTAEQAKKWCEENDFTPMMFEPAEKNEEKMTVFKYVTNIMLSAEQTQSWVDVISVDKQILADGREVEFTEKDANEMLSNFSNEICADYQHQSMSDDPNRAIASGWIKKLREIKRNGKRVVQACVDWTDRAREYIRNKEYRYTSAEFQRNAKDVSGKSIGTILRAIALTNRHAWDGQEAVTLKIKEMYQEGENKMKLETGTIKLMALPENFNELAEADQTTRFNEAVKKMNESNVQLTQQIAGLKKDGGDIISLQAKISGQEASIKLMQEELNENRFEKFWIGSVKKTYPAEKEKIKELWKLNAKITEDSIAARPEHGLLVTTGNAGDKDNKSSAKNPIEELDAAITKLCTDQKIPYYQAVTLIAKENKDLMKRYNDYTKKPLSE